MFDLFEPIDLVRSDDLKEIIVEGEENFGDLAVESSLKVDCSQIKGTLL